MSQPTSPIAQGFDILDLKNLAKATTKTFERLVPFCHMQNPSAPQAGPTVFKIINKLKAYLEAIDTSIQVVHLTYRMSMAAVTLWSFPHDELKPLTEDHERRKQLEDIVALADDAHLQAQKANAAFRQAQQDFYRIAAKTKDMNITVQVPINPAISDSKMITKPLKDIGSDLVANLGLLADFSHRTSDLSTWCEWVKTKSIAIDGVVVPPQTGNPIDPDTVRSRWAKVQVDCLVYQTLISEMQDRYASMLPLSRGLWQVSASNHNHNKTPTRRNIVRKASNLFQDAVRHLACHRCFLL